MDRKTSKIFVISFIVVLALVSAVLAYIMIGNYSKDTSQELSRLTRDLKEAEEVSFEYNEQRGLETYNQFCVRCHLPNGQGGVSAPPLSGSEFVIGDKERLIKLVVKGMNGKIERAGKTYNLSMPAFPMITHQDLAHVLSYIRTSFGNEASPVNLEEVLRAKIKAVNRDKPYRENELLEQ